MNFRVAFVRQCCTRLSVGLLLLVGLCFVLDVQARSAHAQTTLTVSNCSNDSQLQADVTQANSDNAGDIINFSCSGDIALSSTLYITGHMTLDGSGQSVTLDGQNQMQVLNVNVGVTFTLNALTIAHGYSSDDAGGLINWGTMSITNSTITNNYAYSFGGGIDNEYTMSISNSTVVNNSASYGAGIFNDGGSGGSMSISNITAANNSAIQAGGIDSGGPLNISNSLFANSGGNCYNVTINDQGYNLSSDSSCGFTASTSQQNTNPQLDPSGLQNNGGPTQTIALQQGSPAIDAIPVASCPSTDQRGYPRPDDNETTCDIGAYESGSALDNDLGLTNMPTNITTNATSSQGAVVTYTPPTVVDEDNPLPPVNCTPSSGSTFAIGTTTATCTVTDSDDLNSPVNQSFTVTVQPVLTVSVKTVTTTEGSAFSGVVATGTAYGSTNPLSATITWGDGNNSSVSITPNADGSYSVSGSQTYAEEGTYPLSVTVKDSGSLNATGTGSANVSDAALTLTHFVAGSAKHLNAALGATFTDADPNGQVSDYSATVTWGDGNTSTVTVYKNPLGQGFVLAGLHQYAKTGTYSVTLTIKDSGGSQVTKTAKITVK